MNYTRRTLLTLSLLSCTAGIETMADWPSDNGLSILDDRMNYADPAIQPGHIVHRYTNYDNNGRHLMIDLSEIQEEENKRNTYNVLLGMWMARLDDNETQLRKLTIRGAALTDAHVNYLAFHALDTQQSLETMDLSDNQITLDGIRNLINCLQHLGTIDLRGNNLQADQQHGDANSAEEGAPAPTMVTLDDGQSIQLNRGARQ